MGRYVEVEVDLESFDDTELIDELESRGIFVEGDSSEPVVELAEKIIIEKAKKRDVTLLIDQLLYKLTGQAITGF